MRRRAGPPTPLLQRHAGAEENTSSYPWEAETPAIEVIVGAPVWATDRPDRWGIVSPIRYEEKRGLSRLLSPTPRADLVFYVGMVAGPDSSGHTVWEQYLLAEPRLERGRLRIGRIDVDGRAITNFDQVKALMARWGRLQLPPDLLARLQAYQQAWEQQQAYEQAQVQQAQWQAYWARVQEASEQTARLLRRGRVTSVRGARMSRSRHGGILGCAGGQVSGFVFRMSASRHETPTSPDWSNMGIRHERRTARSDVAGYPSATRRLRSPAGLSPSASTFWRIPVRSMWSVR